MLGIRAAKDNNYFALLPDSMGVYATALTENFNVVPLRTGQWSNTVRSIKKNSHSFVLPYQFVRGESR